MPGPVIKRSGLAAQVIEHLKMLIADGEYHVGQRLPAEGELSALLGVGRSTIREAMRVLANRGIVDVRHGEGTFVIARAQIETFDERLKKAALSDIYEARLLLELPLAELAAKRRRPRDVSAMRTALKRRAAAINAADVAGYMEADFAFHLAIAQAARNRALFDVYETFVRAARPIITSAVDAKYIRDENDPLHGELCEAIAKGDEIETRRLVQSHLRKSLKGISTGLA